MYDGYCNLCSRAVRWIIRNDRTGRFRLEPLRPPQPTGPSEQLQPQEQLRPPQPPEPPSVQSPQLPSVQSPADPDTVLLLRNGRIYSRSTAVLLIASRLRFPWPLLTALMVVPRFIRDPVYDFVARNRKRWFGERSSCYLPS